MGAAGVPVHGDVIDGQVHLTDVDGAETAQRATAKPAEIGDSDSELGHWRRPEFLNCPISGAAGTTMPTAQGCRRNSERDVVVHVATAAVYRLRFGRRRLLGRGNRGEISLTITASCILFWNSTSPRTNSTCMPVQVSEFGP